VKKNHLKFKVNYKILSYMRDGGIRSEKKRHKILGGVGGGEAQFKIEMVGMTAKANPRTLSGGSVAARMLRTASDISVSSSIPIAMKNLPESPDIGFGHFSVQ
jgi:hypothetical protein